MSYRTFALILHLILLGSIALPSIAFAQGFVPLTNLPGLSDFEQSPDLPAFLNSLYKICIGVAATLAVFQIMHAGIKFMTNKGSVSENEQAKDLIRGAVLGLLLVLSPVIVFGIINPKILELDLNVESLKSDIAVPETDPNPGDDTTGGTGGSGSGGNKTYVKSEYFASIELATEWLESVCKNDLIPESEREYISHYRTERDVERMECDAAARSGNDCSPTGNTYLPRCEAHSHAFGAYSRLDSKMWVARPSEKLVPNTFAQRCIADGGKPVIDTNFWRTGPCSNAQLADIGAGTDESSLLCAQGRLVCQANRGEESNFEIK